MEFLQYPTCSTCKKAKKFLKENQIEVVERHMVEENPTKEELRTWYEKASLPIKKFFNTSGKAYREANMKDKIKIMSDNELLDILATNGMMVKRPILVKENTILVGFHEEEWKEKLAKK